MNSLSTMSMIALITSGTLLAEAEAPFVLTDGTPVRTRISRNLSSADAKVGETVDFEVLDEITIDGVQVVPRGATAIGTVTEAQAKRRMARGGKLGVNIDYLRLPTGDKAPLRGVKQVKGGGHTGAMTGGIVATAIVFFPAAPFFLFMHGKDITIPKGHEVTVYINGDIKLDRTKFVAAAPPPPPVSMPVKTAAASGKPLTNEDVIALKTAGLGDDLIMSKVRSTGGNYKLDTEDLIKLKQAGISDAIIAVMLEVVKK